MKQGTSADTQEIPATVPPPELAYLANFERLIINLSGRFINANRQSLDSEINHALGAIGGFAEVDRSYIFQFSSDLTRVSNTHEWCAEGIEPGIHDVQDARVDAFAWVLPPLLRGEAVHIPDVAELPPDAGAERRTMQRQGIKSLINVPLICANRGIGFVGFDSVRTHKRWREEHIKLLKLVGEIIAGAIERERATSALARQVELEKLIAQISSRFVGVSGDDLDGEVQHAIQRIGEFTGVDRSYVFRLTVDGKQMDNTHEWCAPGIRPQMGRLQGLAVDEFGYSMTCMKRGEIFHVPNVAELPSGAERERAEFQREGIKTLINVPMTIRGSMIGFLGFDALQTTTWSDNDVRLLRLIGEIFANAADRKSTEDRLQLSLQEKEILLREIHHRVKNNLQVVHSMLYLQANAIRDEGGVIALDAFKNSLGRIKSMATIHERLYCSGELTGVDFTDYLQTLIPNLLRLFNAGERVRIEIEGSGAHLGIDSAIPCGLIVNELISNCLKHAFPGGCGGKILVSMRECADRLFELVVQDDGIGFASSRNWREGKSLGLLLVSDLVDQLAGTATVDAPDGSGCTFRIVFPAPS